MTNIEYHFHITEQVWGKGAPISPNAFMATIQHMLEEYLSLCSDNQNVDEWLNQWNVWLQAERLDESVQT